MNAAHAFQQSALDQGVRIIRMPVEQTAAESNP
jgi:hypothetical protein